MTDSDPGFIALVGATTPESNCEAAVEQEGKTLVHALATFALVGG